MFPIESHEFNFIRPFVQFSLLDTLFSSRRRNYYYRPPPYPLSIPRSSEIPHPLESMEKKRSFPKWNRSNSNPPSIRADINFNLSPSPLHDSRIHRVLGILSPRFRRGEIGESSRPEMGFHLGGGMLLVDLCPKEDRGKLAETYFRDRYLMESWNVSPNLPIFNFETWHPNPFQFLFFGKLCYCYFLWMMDVGKERNGKGRSLPSNVIIGWIRRFDIENGVLELG